MRFVIKDDQLIDSPTLKTIPGVLGVVRSDNQCQVIIGNTVSQAFQEVVSLLPGDMQPAQPVGKPKLTLRRIGAGILLLLPANLLPISIIYLNGGRQEDTILSGIMSLASSNIAVAGIVFIASILVPFTKVIVMFTLLLSIHFKCQQGLRTRILLLRTLSDHESRKAPWPPW